MQPTRSSMTDRQRTILEEYTPRLSLNFEKVFRESGIAERVKPLSARTVAEDQFRSKSLFDEIDLVTSMTFGDKLTVTSLEKAFAVLGEMLNLRLVFQRFSQTPVLREIGSLFSKVPRGHRTHHKYIPESNF